MAIPHSIKDRMDSKYLKAFPALSVCRKRTQSPLGLRWWAFI
jgi:hypothetical protein